MKLEILPWLPAVGMGVSPLPVAGIRRSSWVGEGEDHSVPGHAFHSLRPIGSKESFLSGNPRPHPQMPWMLSWLSRTSLTPDHLTAEASLSADPVFISCTRKPICLWRSFRVSRAARTGIVVLGNHRSRTHSSQLRHNHEVPLSINWYYCPQCPKERRN